MRQGGGGAYPCLTSGTAESGLHDLWHPSCSQSCFPILNISPSGHSGPGYFRNKGTVIAIAALVDSSLSLSGKRPLASHRVGSSYKVPYSLWGPLPSAGTEARPLRLLSVSHLAVPHFLSAWGVLPARDVGEAKGSPGRLAVLPTWREVRASQSHTAGPGEPALQVCTVHVSL